MCRCQILQQILNARNTTRRMMARRAGNGECGNFIDIFYNNGQCPGHGRVEGILFGYSWLIEVMFKLVIDEFDILRVCK